MSFLITKDEINDSKDEINESNYEKYILSIMNDCKVDKEKEIENIIMEKWYQANDENFAKLPFGTLRFVKLFLLKGYELSDASFKFIMSDSFADDDFYQTIIYLYKNKYKLPEILAKQFE